MSHQINALVVMATAGTILSGGMRRVSRCGGFREACSGSFQWSCFPDLMNNTGLDEFGGEYDLSGMGGEVE